MQCRTRRNVTSPSSRFFRGQIFDSSGNPTSPIFGHPEQNSIRHRNAVVDVGEYLQVQAQALLELPREMPRLRCHDRKSCAEPFELILCRLKSAQLSGPLDLAQGAVASTDSPVRAGDSCSTEGMLLISRPAKQPARLFFCSGSRWQAVAPPHP